MVQSFSLLSSTCLNFAIGVNDLSHSQLLVLFLPAVQCFSIFGCKESNQSDFGIDQLVMSMCSVVLCFWKRLFAITRHSLGKLFQPLPCSSLYSKAKLLCYSRYLMTSYFSFQFPMMNFFLSQFQIVLYVIIEPFNFSFFGISGWGIDFY